MDIKKTVSIILLIAMLFSLTGCVRQAMGSLFGYVVRFDANGGDLVSGEVKQFVKPGQDAEPPVFVRDGYQFDGFDGSFSDIRESVTLTAKWLKLCAVSFDAGGGELIGAAEQLVAEGGSPDFPEASRAGWIFEGWDPRETVVRGDTVFTALWSRRALTATEVSEKISPAVIEIITQDSHKRDRALGSGFFIDDKGTAVTNYHVMEGAYYAKATTQDGREHVIMGVISYDKDLDLAIIKVNLTNTPYLSISQDGVETGQTVYAIGSSLGLTGTFSNGIVSTASRDIDGVDCIQVTAPISQGNSGGPLVNEYGEVIGVNSMTASGGQNLNFAINIKELEKLPEDAYLSMNDFGALTLPPPGFYHLYSDREKEPNDSDSRAYALTIGADPVAGEIGSLNDEDCYSITSESGHMTMFYMSIFDPESNALGYRFGYYSGSEFVELELQFVYEDIDGRFSADFYLEPGVTYYVFVTAMPVFGPLFEYPIYYAVWAV